MATWNGMSSNGPLSYVVKLTDGRELKRHVDHLRSRLDGEEIELSPTPVAHTEPSKEPFNYDLIQTWAKSLNLERMNKFLYVDPHVEGILPTGIIIF